MTKTRIIPFDIEKAKAGAKVVTDDERRRSVRILEYNRKVKSDYTHTGDNPIVALVDMGDYEDACYFTNNGEGLWYNLCIEEEVEAECMESQNGDIVLEDFNGGEGFYKVHLDYLNMKQVEEIEQMVRAWNKELKPTDDDIIKACIGMCLTDVSEQRFKDYNTNLRDCLAWLEKQGGQKTSDEPKIIPDEWYVCTLSIESSDWQFFEGFLYPGSEILRCYPLDEKDFQEHFRTWSIKDARPGSILYSLDSKQPFIFKQRKAHEQAEVYCGINIYGKFFVEDTKNCIITTDKYIPATKEQHDLLFLKMKEAGYVWDPVKKELKIEKVKTRRMTHRELAWWLRDKPEEHRELKMSVDDPIIDSLYYYDNETNVTVNKDIIIRRNGGEWEEPLIEEMED